MLFAQALEEGTFHYSYESYKLPALNSHYLCYDIVHTTRDIEKKVLMDGNFIPLSEEFEQTLKEDIFIRSNIDDKGTLLYFKDKNGSFYNICDSDLKVKIRNYTETAKYIIDICEVNNFYLSSLLNTLIENIFSDNYNYKNSDKIYSATRMLITELVNAGYSKKYLYSTIVDFFFNPNKIINATPDTVIDFFNCFTFEEYDYQVIFGINRKAAILFEKIENIVVRKPTDDEKKILNLQRETNYVTIIHLKSIDIYSAYESALRTINTFLSLHSINQHDSKIFITHKAIVSKKIEDSFDNGITVKTSINPLKKKGNSSILHALFDDIMLTNNISPLTSFYRAASLHSGAIESKDISNQLLNLWTVLEVLIDTKRDNEDKINTICTILGAVLNRCYMYLNIEQLLHDIKKCLENDIDMFFQGIEHDKDDLDNVEKLALLLSLDTQKDKLEELINNLLDYPLLVYRIRNFSDNVLSNSKTIYEYLQRHEKRVKWHIMRIYRNRNMIVHNGSSMPYRDIIIENLHFYVDVLIETLIEYYNLGILNHSTIYKDILNSQVHYHLIMCGSLSKKGKVESKAITIENALDLIFNGYSGNVVKKTLNDVIEENKKHNQVIDEGDIEYDNVLLPMV